MMPSVMGRLPVHWAVVIPRGDQNAGGGGGGAEGAVPPDCDVKGYGF